MKPIHRLLTALPVIFALPATAAPLAGARPTEWPASAERHTTSIQRAAANDAEKKLIAAAEKSPPNAAALLEAIRKEDDKTQPLAGQWWNKEVCGIRIPFAITADAVDYYTQLVNGYAQKKLVRYAQPSSAFAYQTKAAQHDRYELDGKSFENITVVTLAMSFQQSFAATVAEGFSFEKKREVVFDKDGKIIHVSGDGDIEVPVFAM